MRGENQPIIQTVELTKIYKDFWGRARVRALDGLNMEIQRGEVFGLLGPNGSGKTTTVRLVLGLLFPSGGLVRIFGKSPREVDTKKRIGYMPEESHLYEYLNAEETLDFFGRLFGLSRRERRERTDSLIEMVGLERARRRPIGKFSKGMARRIGLAQALINDPDVLILDEPTTGLDPLGSRQMKDLIGMLRERGKTVFLCSHLLSDVEQICDRVCILYGGKAREVGSVSELLTEQERMEIRAPRLSDEALKGIRDIVRQDVGSEDGVEIGPSSRRLEEYFLRVVEQARRERLTTAGAEAGGPAAAFLTREEKPAEAEDMIEGLVRAGRAEEEAPEETPEREAKPAAPEQVEDREMIESLVKPEERREKEKQEEEPEVAEAPEGEGVRHDMLDRLMGSEQEKSNQESSEEVEQD
jgi:ABC-2 type transport system ATP-binding protein